MEKIKVFVVDDNIAARNMLTAILKSDDNIVIAGEAGTGQGSVIMLEEADPDVVLIEANVGGGMSIENIVKEIKKIKQNVNVILCADAPAMSKLTSEKMIQGVKDIIRKPCKKETLLRVLNDCKVR